MALNRERVVQAGLQLLNEVGLGGLTLRRLAKELDVQAPTLYWHIKSKQELLDEMATMMLKQLVESEALNIDGSWQESSIEACRRLRQMLLAYRDGAKIFSGTYLTDDSLLESMETPLQKLTGAALSLVDAVRGWTTLYSYVIGFTIEEQATHTVSGERDNRYEPSRRAQRVDEEKYPLTVAAGQEMFANFDERFDYGLQLIITGIEQKITTGHR